MMETLLRVLDLFGVSVFAVTGALAAGRKRMDLFGVAMLAMVTALGGGTLRDLLLGAQPVFWIADPVYLLLAVGAGVGTFCAVRIRSFAGQWLTVLDAFGLAVFALIGTEKALTCGTSRVIAATMGVMTAVMGGILRDVLSGEVPLILRREIYATAALCGTLVFLLVQAYDPRGWVALGLSIAVTLGLRLAAIRWSLALPVFTTRQGGDA